MTYERAQQLLGQSVARPERDPLDGPMDVDPLSAIEERDPLGGLSESEVTASEQAPAEEAAETTEAEAQAPAEEVAPAIDPAAVKTEADGRKRLNINRKNPDGSFVYTEQTRAVLLMADELGIDYEDARQRILGDRQPASAKAADAAQAAIAEPVKTSAQIDADIASLKAQRQTAREGFDDAAVIAASEQIEDLLRQRSDAVQREVERRESQRHAQAGFDKGVSESIGRASSLYPDAATEGSALHSAIQAEADRLASLNSPLFNDPEWPETVAVKIANRLGIAPRVAPAKPAVTTPAPKAAAPVAPVKRASPVPAPGAVSSAPPAVNPLAQLQEKLKTATARNQLKGPDGIEAIARQIFELRAA